MIASWFRSNLARAGLALACLALGGAASAQPVVADSRPATRQMGITQRQGAELPLDSMWFDQTGNEVALGDYFQPGRPVLIVPVFYTCESSCMLILEGTMFLIRNMKELNPGDQYAIVVFSINPKEGPADAKKKHGEVLKRLNEFFKKKVDPDDIHFLTGSFDSISQLTTALGYKYIYKPTTMDISHPAGIMLATPEGKIAQYFFGWEFPQRLIINAINEAKTERVGGKTESKLFGCLMFNPATGTYVLIAERALLVSGIATVLIVALCIGVMSFRHRTRLEGPDPEEAKE